MSTRTILFMVCLLAVAAFGACKPDPLTVGLRFPSQQAFLQSDFGRISIIEVAASDLGACPRIIEQAINDSFSPAPVLDSGPEAICSFRNGGVTFDEIGEGPKAFVGVARDESNTAILAGCAIGEAYNDAPAIDIVLAVTDAYRTAAVEMLACSSIDDKCDRGCR